MWALHVLALLTAALQEHFEWKYVTLQSVETYVNSQARQTRGTVTLTVCYSSCGESKHQLLQSCKLSHVFFQATARAVMQIVLK